MIPLDKTYHVIAGLLVALVVGVLAGPFWGVAASIAAGLAKEGYDATVNHRRLAAGLPPAHDVDPLDAAATFAGGAIGFAVLMIILP